MRIVDEVDSPKHYQVFMNIEAKDIIELVLKSDLVKDMNHWQTACLKDILKYRLRAGEKGNALIDIEKANKYKEMGEANE